MPDCKSALNQFKADKKTQLRKNRPELGCYEDKLAMHINSAHGNIFLEWWTINTYKYQTVDEIEFKFTHVDPNNWDRVFTFVVDVREPKVYKCTFLLQTRFYLH